MALIGISLIVASVVLFCLRPPAWLPLRNLLASLRHQRATVDDPSNADHQRTHPEPHTPLRDAADAHGDAHCDGDGDDDGQATPKAAPSTPGMAPSVPSFSLSEPLPSAPPNRSATTPSAATSPSPTTTTKPPAASDLMPPPPFPPRAPASSSTTAPSPSAMAPPPVPVAQARRMPTLAPAPTNKPSPNRSLPVPSRAPGTSTLAPPPTHSSIPTKPSRQVKLSPGHSPMDWARLAQSPTSDLRGLPPSTPYLRVTPSQLRQMTGRKGKDAWSVYSGKVYNISPYISFHPGGKAELLRSAGRDGTRMFAEVHPWVNYETMLSACLIGILVDEHEVEQRVGKAMEELD